MRFIDAEKSKQNALNATRAAEDGRVEDIEQFSKMSEGTGADLTPAEIKKLDTLVLRSKTAEAVKDWIAEITKAQVTRMMYDVVCSM